MAALRGATAEPGAPAARVPTRRRRDLQGLRAVAVIGVVLFHAGALRGGFVGVDAFYVLSGFLMTGILYRDLSTGRLSLLAFWGRRARRLLPAAGTVLVATAVAVTLVAPPLRVRSELRDIAAAALYFVNYRLAAQGTDYLNADAPPSPVQHYWSLAVEEQFYVLWPLLLLAAFLVVRRRRHARPDRHRPDAHRPDAHRPEAHRPEAHRPDAHRIAVTALLVGVTIASFAADVVLTRTHPPFAFFALPTRMWELSMGGLVAMGAPTLRRVAGVVAEVMSALGLGLLVVAMFLIDRATAYPGWAALLPVTASALIIAGGVASQRAAATRALAARVLQPIGALSYSWYLWHWPVLVLAPRVLHRSELSAVARTAAVMISLVLATASFLLVEQPGLHAWPGLRRRTVLALGAAVPATVCACVALLIANAGPPLGTGGPQAAPRLRVARTAAEQHALDPSAARVRMLTAQVQAQLAAAVAQTSVPADLTPPLADAHGDKATPFDDGCHLDYYATVSPPCAYADATSNTRVVLFGDSHAVQWFPALLAIASSRHWRLEDTTKTICPPLDLHLWQPGWGRAYSECDQWRTSVLARVRAEHPAVVVLGVARHYGPEYRITVYDRAWIDGLSAVVRQIRSTGAAVLVMGPTPKPAQDVPDCLADHLDDMHVCGTSRRVAVDASGEARERAAVEAAGGTFADVPSWACTARSCPAVVGDQLVYRDDNHLTTGYATFLRPLVAAEVDAALAAATSSRVNGTKR